MVPHLGQKTVMVSVEHLTLPESKKVLRLQQSNRHAIRLRNQRGASLANMGHSELQVRLKTTMT
jgi:hypothetical protein